MGEEEGGREEGVGGREGWVKRRRMMRREEDRKEGRGGERRRVKGRGIVHCWTRSRHAELEKWREGVCDTGSTYCQAVVASLHILRLCAALVTNGIVVLSPPVKVRLLL